MDTDKIRKQIAKQTPAEPVEVHVSDLRQGMKKINLDAKVFKLTSPAWYTAQFGNSALLANAIVGR
jgi:hypothetical protein